MKNKKEDILLIQFRENEEVAQLEKNCFLKSLAIPSSQLKIINFFKGNPVISKKDLLGFNAIIIGGSADFSLSQKHRTKKLWESVKKALVIIKILVKENIHTLGICLGHQLLGFTLGSKVIRDKSQQEVGSFSISLTTEGRKDPLFKGVPKNFIVQHGHKDSIQSVPPHAVLLAKGTKGRFQSFKYKNIYGVQFHPEIKPHDLKIRLEYAPEYKIGKIRTKPSPHTSKIIKNFFTMAKKF